jgi:peroxin-11B
MRLGKPLEHLQAALRAAHSSGDAAQQITKVGRQLSYFGYLSYDTLIWVSTPCCVDIAYSSRIYQFMQANAVKFLSLRPETAKKVGKISNRFWLAGILFGIAHGILEVRTTLPSHLMSFQMSA